MPTDSLIRTLAQEIVFALIKDPDDTSSVRVVEKSLQTFLPARPIKDPIKYIEELEIRNMILEHALANAHKVTETSKGYPTIQSSEVQENARRWIDSRRYRPIEELDLSKNQPVTIDVFETQTYRWKPYHPSAQKTHGKGRWQIATEYSWSNISAPPTGWYRYNIPTVAGVPTRQEPEHDD